MYHVASVVHGLVSCQTSIPGQLGSKDQSKILNTFPELTWVWLFTCIRGGEYSIWIDVMYHLPKFKLRGLSLSLGGGGGEAVLKLGGRYNKINVLRGASVAFSKS